MLEILKTGPLATIQDHGRKGYAHLGVPRSGALDLRSLDRANALAGNSEHAAALEIAQGRFSARFDVGAVIAVAGAMEIPPMRVAAGETVEIGPSAHGMFSYLAIRGGIDVPIVLGSRSTDTLSGIGPPILRRGTFLRIGTDTGRATDTRHARTAGRTTDAGFATDSGHAKNAGHAIDTGTNRGIDTATEMGRGTDSEAETIGVPEAQVMPAGEIRVRVRWGPRADWFVSARELLSGYQVKMSNRVAARLAGPALTRTEAKELPSEGLIAGAIQVPPDGQPIIFLSDHPTTGGYPVIAVVHPADLPMVAQARPGTKVIFYGSER